MYILKSIYQIYAVQTNWEWQKELVQGGAA